ncbi:MAG: S-layer homology domain-containing protein, partial [Aminipila sp.]
IAKGTSESAFTPNANITRQDMAVMITRYADYMKKDITGTNEATKFADESQIAIYAKKSVASMQKAGIINGVKAADGSYSFMPKNNATRAEAAKMIYQMVK